jgi:hypothetical protein
MMMHRQFTHLVSVPYTANLFDRTTATLERMTGIIAGSSDDMIGEGRPAVARDIPARLACAAAIPARSQIVGNLAMCDDQQVRVRSSSAHSLRCCSCSTRLLSPKPRQKSIKDTMVHPHPPTHGHTDTVPHTHAVLRHPNSQRGIRRVQSKTCVRHKINFFGEQK